MANPDNTRNNNVRLLILLMPASAPVTNTISHANIRTTIVRIAVATFEFVFRIPHFARIAVIPAKKGRTYRIKNSHNIRLLFVKKIYSIRIEIYGTST